MHLREFRADAVEATFVRAPTKKFDERAILRYDGRRRRWAKQPLPFACLSVFIFEGGTESIFSLRMRESNRNECPRLYGNKQGQLPDHNRFTNDLDRHVILSMPVDVESTVDVV